MCRSPGLISSISPAPTSPACHPSSNCNRPPVTISSTGMALRAWGAGWLADRTPGPVLCDEEDGLPVGGIAISNSPTRIREADLRDRVLIQRSSAGTQAAAAVESGDIWAASLIVARATVQACVLRKPETPALLASADPPEDPACAP